MLRQPMQRFQQMQASDIDIYRNELRKTKNEIVSSLTSMGPPAPLHGLLMLHYIVLSVVHHVDNLTSELILLLCRSTCWQSTFPRVMMRLSAQSRGQPTSTHMKQLISA